MNKTKRILLVLLAVFSAIGLWAQTTLLTQGFESTNMPSGWTTNTAGSGNRISTADKHGGSRSCQIIVPANGAGNPWSTQLSVPAINNIPLEHVIRISFWMRAVDGDGQIRISTGAKQLAQEGAYNTDRQYLPTLTISDTWTQYTHEIVYDAGRMISTSSTLKLTFDMGSVKGKTYYVDDILVEDLGHGVIDPNNYGNFDEPFVDYAIIKSSGFEINSLAEVGTVTGNISLSTEDKHDGAKSIKAVNGAGTTPDGLQLQLSETSVIANNSYKIYFWAKAVGGAGQISVSTAGGDQLTGSLSAKTISGEWAQYVYEGLKATGSNLQLYFNMGSVADKTYFIDDIYLVDITEPILDFSDGDNATRPLAKEHSKFLGNIIAASSVSSVPANFGTYWNQVTAENGGKWGTVLGNINNTTYNWNAADAAYNYAKNNGLSYKYHALVWGSQEPSGLTGVAPEVQKAKLEAYIEAVAERYPDLEFIDVVNEPLHAPSNMREAIGGNGETGWDWIVWSFEKARSLFPNAKLLINEYGVIGDLPYAQRYMEIINILKERNLIDAIGIQCHHFTIDGVSVATMKQVLDLLETSGLPVYVTEFDATGDGSEKSQYRSYKQKFPVLWEHPAVAGVTLWGYITGSTWKEGTGIVSGPATTATERLAMKWLKSYMVSDASHVPNKFVDTDEPAGPQRITTFDFESGNIDGWSKPNPAEGIDITTEDKHGGTYALKLVNGTGTSAWSVQATTPKIPIVKGHTYKLSFWVRAVGGGGQGRVSTGAGQLGNQYLASQTNLPNTWRQITYNNLSAVGDTLQLSFDFGYIANKTYYIDDIVLEDLSADEEIIEITGDPLAKDHTKFLGNVIAGYIPATFDNYWNQVTAENGGKWGSVEGTRDVFSWTQADLAYNHAQTKKIPYKYHTFVWGNQEPNWLTTISHEEQIAELKEYMQAVAERYPNIDYIDVVNEPLTGHNPSNMRAALGGTGETGWDWVIESFRLAREYFPNTDLHINDYGIISDMNAARTYVTIINLLKERDLIDGIGIQCHAFNMNGVSITTMTNVLDLLGATGLPIYVSELDMDVTSATNETGQANLYRQKFPVLWEHESVAGVTLWGYIMGTTWRTTSGIVEANNKEREAMTWLKEYMASETSKAVKNKFTSDVTLKTLEITGGELTPAFSPDVFQYTVKAGAEGIVIGTIATNNRRANVEITTSSSRRAPGAQTVLPGQTITITITGEDASFTGTYTITVKSDVVPPLVYNEENTGAAYPKPALIDDLTQLPFVQKLPDPFKFTDGSRSTDFADWSQRRNEIKAMIEHYEIGTKPTNTPEEVTATYNEATRVLTVNVTVNGQTLTLTSTITLPAGEGPFPAMIGGSGNIYSSRNIAQIPFNHGQVMAHTQVRGNEPINRLYPELTYMGAYSAWSWGISRLIDGIEIALSDKIDVSRLGVTGCSYAGKMALFAGAFDERIALTIAQESGGGGYPAWRVSETIGSVENIGSTNYSWFVEDMRRFSGNNAPRLPHDHHELLAMVAPRALLVTGNADMEWLADPSGYVSSRAAKYVYDTFGIGDRFGMSITNGHAHCAFPADLTTRVEAFVDKFLLGKEDVNTDVFAYPASYENINYQFWMSDWANVTEPTVELEQYFYEAESRECIGIGSDFVVGNDEGASNGQYLTITTVSGNDTPPAIGSVINLPVTVNNHGTYYFYFRLNCQSTDNDSFWVKIGGRTYEKHEGLSTNGEWAWLPITSAELTKGRHVVTIGYNGGGAKLDRIYVTNDATEIPTGMGGVECECIALPIVTTFDFETGDIEGWAKQNPGGGIDITQEDKYGGNYALKMVSRGGSAWSVQAFSPHIDIVPEHEYKVSFWIKAAGGTGRGRISTQVGKLGGTYWADFNVPADEWTQIVYDGLIAAESPVRLSFDIGYVARTYYIDDIMIEDMTAKIAQDATLKSLEVVGEVLTPAFDPEISEYTVLTGASSVEIIALSNNSNASVFGAGTSNVSLGANDITITVTGEDGVSTKQYKITVTRLNSSAIDWLTEFQVMDGLGTSNAFNKASAIRQVYEINPESGQRLLDLLFDDEKGIGLDIVRMIVGDGGITNPSTRAEWGNRWYDGPSDTVEPEEGQFVWDQPGWNDPTAPNYKGNFDKDNVWMCHKAMEYGVKTFYANAWTPPYWMKQNNSVVGNNSGNQTQGTQGDRLKDDYYGKYANYLIQFALGYYREFGIHITHIGPANESEASHTSYSGFRINVEQYQKLLGEMKIKLAEYADDFAALGITPPIIVGPEGTSINQSANTGGSNYGALMSSDIGKEMFGVFSTHLYGGANTFANGPQTATAATGSFPTWLRDYNSIWQTEYMTQNNSSSASSANTQLYANQGITDGLYWANLISNMFASDPGFTGWIWWWAAAANGADGSDLIRIFNSGSPQGNGSTTSGVYRVFKRFYTFGNFSRFVNPGFVRIGANRAPVSGVNVTAYKDPATDKYVIVAVNTSTTTEQTISFSLKDFPTGANAVVGYVTDASRNQKKLDPISITGGQFIATLPINSVITFVPESIDNLPGLDTNRDIFSILEAEENDGIGGNVSVVDGSVNKAVDGLKNGNYIKYANVDFVDGSANGGIVRRHVLSLDAIVKAPVGGIIEARIDNPYDGKIVGRFVIAEGNNSYQTVSAQINTGDNAAQGFHDLYLIFGGSEESIFTVDRFVFGEKVVATDFWAASNNLVSNGSFETGSGSPRRPTGWTTIAGANALEATSNQTYSAPPTATNQTAAYSAQSLAGAGVAQDVTTALAGKDGLKMQIISQFMPTTFGESDAQVKLVAYNGTTVVDTKVIASRKINQKEVTYGKATQKAGFLPWFWFQLDSVFTYEEPTVAFTKIQIEFTDNTANDLFIEEVSLTLANYNPIVITPMEVVEITPADGTAGVLDVALNAEVKVTFNQSIETFGTPDLTNITISGATGVSASFEGNVITIAHSDFDYDTEYTVTIPAGSVADYNSDIVWTFTTRKAPMELISTIPANGTAGVLDVALNAEVKVTFNQSIETFGTPDLTNITISGVSGVSASFTSDVITIAHANFDYDTEYTVTVPSGSVVGYDNAIVWKFTTRKPPMELISVTPADGTAGVLDVALNADVKVTFNQPVATFGTPNLTNIVINGATEVSASFVGNEIIIAHGDFQYDTEYTVTIPTGSVVGYTDAIIWKFTTRKPDMDVISKTPADGTAGVLDVALNAEVKVTFNQSVATFGTPNLTNIVISGATGVSASFADNVITIAHGDFQYDTEYTVTIPAGSVVGYDNAIVWKFTTRKPPMELISATPANGTVNVMLNADVKVTFNQSITMFGTPDLSNIVISGANGVSALFADNVITIAHSNFEYDTEYTVTIPAGSIVGYDEAVVWKFTTIKAMAVVSLIPADGTAGVLDVALNAEVKVIFNQSVATFGTPVLDNVTINGVTIGVSASFADNVITIAHSDFQYDTEYTVTVPTGSVVGYDNAILWKFTTRKPPMELISVIPNNGATGVAVDAEITVTFNQSVAMFGTPKLYKIELSETMGVQVSSNGSVITITHNDFAPNTEYTVTIPAGTIIGYDMDIVRKFTTSNAPIEILAVTPADGSIDVDVDAPITVTFQKNPYINGIEPSWDLITIKDAAGNDVSGAVMGMGISGNTFTISHSTFNYETEYTVNIPVGTITGLTANKTWKFTTGKNPNGIGNLNTDNVTVYPTITSDKVQVTTSNKAHIRLCDLTGKTIEAHDSMGGVYELDLSSRATGVYFTIITIGEKTITHKIVKK
jgi:Beta-1,4-xylanase